jgi:hypothetical protein
VLKKLIKYAVRYLDATFPCLEPAELRLPLFSEGELIESARPSRPHVLLDIKPQKGLVVRSYPGPRHCPWVYDVLLDGVLFEGVSSHLVEADWRPCPKGVNNDATEQSN